MLIEVRLDPATVQLWQSHLIARVAAMPGIVVRVVAAPGTARAPRGLAPLLELERLISGARPGGASESVAFETLKPFATASGPADLILDLTDAPASAGNIPLLRLVCDGLPFTQGAADAVLASRDPVFETLLDEGTGATVLSRWHPAVEVPHHAAAALEMLAGRAGDMLAVEIGRLAAGRPAALGPAETPAHKGGSASAFFLRALETRLAGRLARLLGRAPDWHVALRPRRGDGLPALGPEGFRRLADDGCRFYADPFLFAQGGETFLFVEEYPYATGRGILSLSRLAADGTPSHPVPILEGPDHLSYPFVFEAEGAIWMIPETSARRTVELYRADPFPDRWTLTATLIEGVDLADATLLRRDDGWWLFAAERARWASSWDTLVLWRADRLQGPWRPHPANPVLVDLTAARPGGRILEIGGRLVRPAQDCAGGYGARLAFAAIEQLDETGFRQEILTRAKPFGRNSGLHSYDRTDRFEVIDLFGPR